MRDQTVLKIERFLRSPLLILGLLVGVGLLTVAIVALLVSFEPVREIMADQFWFSIIVLAIVFQILMGGTSLCILAERKVSAYIQDRLGPNRVGYLGLLQSVADGLKMLLKEDIIPGNIDRPLFLLAPAISFMVAMATFAVIPWAGDVHWPWMAADAAPVSTLIADVDIGFLYIIAIASMGVYGVVLAGYASNNKYAFFGGIRAAAQMVSYEVPLGLALLCILLTVGTLQLDTIVQRQAMTGLWYVLYQPLPFLLLLIATFAETNRAPFDLAECEQELVGGFHTEYSALKFGLFFLGEYAHMIIGSALIIALFLGGWDPIPFWGAIFGVGLLADSTEWWAALIKFGVFWGKIALFIAFFMVVRWTLPRFRFDQLMRVAWKGMVPAGMMLVLGTSGLVLFDLHRVWWASLLMNVIVLALCLGYLTMTRTRVTGRQENLPDVRVVGA